MTQGSAKLYICPCLCPCHHLDRGRRWRGNLFAQFWRGIAFACSVTVRDEAMHAQVQPLPVLLGEFAAIAVPLTAQRNGFHIVRVKRGLGVNPLTDLSEIWMVEVQGPSREWLCHGRASSRVGLPGDAYGYGCARTDQRSPECVPSLSRRGRGCSGASWRDGSTPLWPSVLLRPTRPGGLSPSALVAGALFVCAECYGSSASLRAFPSKGARRGRRSASASAACLVTIVAYAASHWASFRVPFTGGHVCSSAGGF